MPYARVQGGVATDVRSVPPDGCFVDSIVAEFLTVPDEVRNGWLFNGTTFTAPPPPSQAQLDAAAAAATQAALAKATAEAAALARTAKEAKDTADAVNARADAKVAAIGNMTPAQVKAWVAANVTTLGDAKDLLATLAVVVSVLARKL